MFGFSPATEFCCLGDVVSLIPFCEIGRIETSGQAREILQILASRPGSAGPKSADQRASRGQLRVHCGVIAQDRILISNIAVTVAIVTAKVLRIVNGLFPTSGESKRYLFREAGGATIIWSLDIQILKLRDNVYSLQRIQPPPFRALGHRFSTRLPRESQLSVFRKLRCRELQAKTKELRF